jgi:hypothetical protein
MKTQYISLPKGIMTLKRVWPGIKEMQGTCRGEFVSLNLGMRGGK